MAFYPTNLKKPKDWYSTCVADTSNHSFTLNSDYSLVIKHTLRLLKWFLENYDDCILPVSGGMDSTFLMYCYHHLIQTKQIKNNSFSLVCGVYQNYSKILNSGFHQVRALEKTLDLSVTYIDINVDDYFDSVCLDILKNEAELRLGRLFQFSLFNSLKGTVLIPEGRPIVIRKPWLRDTKLDDTLYLVDVTFTYERNHRINLFSYDKELYSSFITPEVFSFRYPQTTKKPYDEQYDYIQLRHQYRSLFYKNFYRGIKKKTSFIHDELTPKTHLAIRKILSESPVQLHPDEHVYHLSDYYCFSWGKLNIH